MVKTTGFGTSECQAQTARVCNHCTFENCERKKQLDRSIRSLRLPIVLWDKIEKCSGACGLTINAYCAKMLSAVCDNLLQSESEDKNEEENK